MSSSNPILNNPFEEPRLYYATNSKGELDYEQIREGRRPFSPEIQTIPVRSGPQKELAALEEEVAAYGSHLINLLRREVKVWRAAAYPNTTRVTKELLHHWFLDPARENHLFFAQREAIETAIWLNEVAAKSNPGQHALGELARAQNPEGNTDPTNALPRLAFKMATGSGKTVVMAALIAYHYCNRQEYRADPRFYYADPKKLVAHVARAISTGPAGAESIRPIFNYYNPTGATRFVHGNTTKETYPTRHSHVNVVVLDSGWEGQAAKVLDDLAAEGRIVSWVKNHFLNFRIPYVDREGESRDYLPDFIVRLPDFAGQPRRLIIEVTGARRDKPEKIWTVTERWLPAMNNLPATRGFGRWDFIELAGQTQVADFRNILLKWLDAPVNAKPRIRASVWSLRRELEETEGPFTEDFELPKRSGSKPAISFD